jgi:hypothetical protein
MCATATFLPVARFDRRSQHMGTNLRRSFCSLQDPLRHFIKYLATSRIGRCGGVEEVDHELPGVGDLLRLWRLLQGRLYWRRTHNHIRVQFDGFCRGVCSWCHEDAVGGGGEGDDVVVVGPHGGRDSTDAAPTVIVPFR